MVREFIARHVIADDPYDGLPDPDVGAPRLMDRAVVVCLLCATIGFWWGVFELARDW